MTRSPKTRLLAVAALALLLSLVVWGALEIAWAGFGPVVMTGPAAISFRGSIDMRDVAT